MKIILECPSGGTLGKFLDSSNSQEDSSDRTPLSFPSTPFLRDATFKAREKGLEGMRGKEEEEEGKGGRIRFDVG